MTTSPTSLSLLAKAVRHLYVEMKFRRCLIHGSVLLKDSVFSYFSMIFIGNAPQKMPFGCGMYTILLVSQRTDLKCQTQKLIKKIANYIVIECGIGSDVTARS